jgi:lipoprotein NlpD
MTGTGGWTLACALVAALAAAGCAVRSTPAPVVDRAPARAAPPPKPQAPPAPAAATAAAAEGHYLVKRGDTLYSIALEHGLDYRELAQWNKLDDPGRIRIGQLLRIQAPEDRGAVRVGPARGAGPVESRPLDAAASARQAQGDGSAKSAPKALRLPYSKENLALLAKDEAKPQAQPVAAAPPPATARVEPRPEARPAPAPAAQDADAIEFVWPVRGRLLASFSEPNNKGVDIAGRVGDPVVAAAPGRVMYTGTGIRGYGKLIVIKHDNGFNSVYAHNKEIHVKEGQTVARGQRIAELGDTDADAPKLHFEIRKSGKPVDPLRYLPPS